MIVAPETESVVVGGRVAEALEQKRECVLVYAFGQESVELLRCKNELSRKVRCPGWGNKRKLGRGLLHERTKGWRNWKVCAVERRARATEQTTARKSIRMKRGGGGTGARRRDG